MPLTYFSSKSNYIFNQVVYQLSKIFFINVDQYSIDIICDRLSLKDCTKNAKNLYFEVSLNEIEKHNVTRFFTAYELLIFQRNFQDEIKIAYYTRDSVDTMNIVEYIKNTYTKK